MTEELKGEWKLETSENFDELMKELGVSFVLRKIGKTTKPNVNISFDGDQWYLTTKSSLKTHVIAFKLDQEFLEETMDGRKVQATFTLDGNKLVETQRNKDNKIVCTITRELLPNGQMKTVAKAGNVEAVRVYLRDE